MVYASKVKGQKLTFCVSGKLWNRSLVMMDKETKSLWSHLLGRCMDGKLKGSTLVSIPSSTTTWAAWKRQHPKTTVLAMSRTNRKFTKEVFRRPGDYVLGWENEGQPYSCSFAVLQKRAVVNVGGKSPLLVTFDPKSGAAHLFSSVVGGQTLEFESVGETHMKDRQSGTVWDRSTGRALEGKLEGKSLSQRVGIISYARAWERFHPKNLVVAP